MTENTTPATPANVGRDDEVGLTSIYLAERTIAAFKAPGITLRDGSRVEVRKLKAHEFDTFLVRFFDVLAPLLDEDGGGLTADAVRPVPLFVSELLTASTGLVKAAQDELDADERFELLSTALFVSFVHGGAVRRFLRVVRAVAESASPETEPTSAAVPAVVASS